MIWRRLYVIFANIVLFVVILLILIFLGQNGYISSDSETIIGGVLTAIFGVETGFLTYYYSQEDKRIWAKTSDIWDKTLISTTTLVEYFKEMQLIIAAIGLLQTIDRKDMKKYDKKTTVLSYGGWLIAEHPEYFRKDDKTLNDAALAIMQYYFPLLPGQESLKELRVDLSEQDSPAMKEALKTIEEALTKSDSHTHSISKVKDKEIEKIRWTVLSVLNAQYTRLYSKINEHRTTLGVIAVNNEEIFDMITDILEYINKTRDIFTYGHGSFNSVYKGDRKVKIDGCIRILQMLCWEELEINRTGSRDARIDKESVEKRKRAQDLLSLERELLKKQSA